MNLLQKPQLLLAVSTGLLILADPASAGIALGTLFFNRTYQQTAPALAAEQNSFFAAGIDENALDDFAGGTFTDPGGTVYALSQNNDPAFPSWRYQTALLGLDQVDTLFPDGSYTLELTGPAAQVIVRKNGTFYSPEVPLFAASTYNALTSAPIAVSNPFTVRFNSFTTPADEALGFVTLYDYTLGSFVFDEGFLNPSTTSVDLPANTIVVGHNYSLELIFSSRQTGVDDVNGLPTLIGFDRRTTLAFTALAVPTPSTALLGLTGLALLVLRSARRA
jgi:hypothetical protein